MIDYTHSILLIATVALVTIAIRFLPFILFRKKTPQIILYMGKVLPYAIMGMLVVYSLKSISFLDGSHGIPEILALLIVVLLHKWKHNTLLSILVGTVVYMLLVQVVF